VRLNLPPITDGLVLSRLGVDGALLEANDVVLSRAGEVRKRGGKSLAASGLTAGPTTTAYGHVYNGALFVPNEDPVYSSVSGRAVTGLETSTAKFYYANSGGTSFGTVPSRTAITGWTGPHATYGSGIGVGAQYLISHGDEIIGTGVTACPIRWAGSVKSAYSTGTISTTAGSRTVTGSGTTWNTTNIQLGMYLYISDAGSGLNQATYRVTRISSTTSIEVDRALDASVSGASYLIQAVGRVSAPTGIFNDSTPADVNYPAATISASHASRLIVGGTYETLGSGSKLYANRIRWSALASESSGKFAGSDYWDPSAYIDVHPGIGSGGITAMASIGSSLVIAKLAGLFVLRGDLATDGSDAGASVSVISDEVGVESQLGMVATPAGLVIAGPSAAYIYDGASLTDITSPKLGSWWADNEMGNGTVVSYLDGRVVFQNIDVTSHQTLVWDMRRNIFTTQTAEKYRRILRVRGTGNVLAEYGFLASGSVEQHDWIGDFSTTNKNDPSGTSPRMSITTHAAPLGSDPIGQGRVDNVYVNGFVSDAATDNPTLDVTLLYGRVGTSTAAEAAVTVGSISEGTYDKTSRLNIGAANPNYSAARVRIAQANAASDARVYGIALDVEPSNVIT